MFIVGPSQQCAPFAMHSSPNSFPAWYISSRSQVAPKAVPQGKHAAGMPAKNFVPRIPLGPSVARIEGTWNSGIGCVCQKLIPAFVSG